MIPTELIYREKLQPWCIVRQLPKMQNIVVARFTRRNDAEEYLSVLRRLLPTAPHKIIFASMLNRGSAR
ncbi:hypothetical protein [Oscillatoria sp. FACHB-1406]|uniref:hypothetical protein n=1 Tax=Oscillatoria sp. FACHB-1406 TaxID=2692846 RepID=UPI0016835832|nr:hypothetical protein [Oscillatoria sp. FACHB-1406]MBD2577159.1 hypothetical protein [Oscillatoria sp. FACHB-1406]